VAVSIFLFQLKFSNKNIAHEVKLWRIDTRSFKKKGAYSCEKGGSFNFPNNLKNLSGKDGDWLVSDLPTSSNKK
jgi:hypothetical protein